MEGRFEVDDDTVSPLYHLRCSAMLSTFCDDEPAATEQEAD
jgi:hypothetical protein